MHLKDYYAILEVETSASVNDIKKSYRKKALQFHPDINQNDPYATAQFNEIKEAYEVLTDPSKKEYYLQQRWYNHSIAKRKKQEAITPVSILKQSLELEKYVSKLDLYRMDKVGLEQYILELLSNERIDQLKKFNEPEIIVQTVSILFKTITSLPLKYAESVIIQLNKLGEYNTIALELIESFTRKLNRRHFREKYSLLFIIVITITLCLLIFLAGA